MKVEIWSDVMCPFCYIGKRKFENALNQFAHKNEVEIEWKSFQLAPEMVTEPGKNINQYLAEHKGWTLEYAKGMNDHVSQMAAQVGLQYNLDQVVVANSFDAHRLMQFAKTKGLGDAIEESLFKAYFTEGKNTADHGTLAELGIEVGLDPAEVKAVLAGSDYANEVTKDIKRAAQIGARGVPFFVFDNKYAVSGAQESRVFLQTLQTAYAESNASEKSETAEGQVCTPDGECN